MNKFIVWEKKWETGIVKIDFQHKHFVGLINKTYTLNKNKKDVEEILNELSEYARIHFSTEEEYFDKTDYPEAEEHIRRHAELLSKVIYYNNKFEKDGDIPKLVEEFLVFLEEWLSEHLVKVDHRYIPWLTEHGIK